MSCRIYGIFPKGLLRMEKKKNWEKELYKKFLPEYHLFSSFPIKTREGRNCT
jgi:hypothetical protein